MKSLRVIFLVLVALLHQQQITGMHLPVLFAGQASLSAECRIETMDEEEHKTFYDYCSTFEGSEINIPRHSVYFTKGEKYTDAERAILQILNSGKTSISQECLVLLQPFVCFYFFKFPLSDDCADGYLPPCNDVCQRTHEACMKDLESMVEQGVINDTKNLEHLECTNFQENSKCINFTPDMVEAPTTTEAPETDAPTTDITAETPEIDAPVECNCAKKVRQNVTRRMVVDPSYTLGELTYREAMRAYTLIYTFNKN